MRLEDAKAKLDLVVNRPFKELLHESGRDLVVDKGRAGKALEIVLGLRNSPKSIDFDDGELKTNKCDRYGKPKETVFISQILSVIDDMLQKKPFEETHLCEKISNILYVPVCKEGDPGDWMFLPSIHVNLADSRFASLYDIWKSDYYSICDQLKRHIETSSNGFIHTSDGQHIQVRSKDSKPYHAIYSGIYKRYVSDKNHAFYFKRDFVYEIKRLAGR